jgi:hypothetical protein
VFACQHDRLLVVSTLTGSYCIYIEHGYSMPLMVNEYLPLNHADFHIMLALGDEERHG